MSKIVPCIWFNGTAEAAARFYVETFKALGREASLLSVTHYGPNMPLPEGEVMTASFSLDGQEYMALNGGPAFPLSPAISLMVHCKDQAEIDRVWDALMAGGGKPVECGWLTDKFGLSWQVVPAELSTLMANASQAQLNAVLRAVVSTVKLDLAAIRRAYAEAEKAA